MLLNKKKIIISVVILLSTTLTAFAFSEERIHKDNWRHWEWGLEAVKNKNFGKATREFDYYIRNKHLHRNAFGVAYFGKGLVAEGMGNDELAITHYKMALQNDIHPTVRISTMAYMNMGTIYMRNEKYKEAIKVYLKAIEIKPKNGLAHYFLGLAYFESGDYENAENQAIEAKELRIKYSALSDKLEKVKSSSSKKTKKE